MSLFDLTPDLRDRLREKLEKEERRPFPPNMPEAAKKHIRGTMDDIRNMLDALDVVEGIE